MGALVYAGIALAVVGLIGTLWADHDPQAWPSHPTYPRTGNIASGVAVAGVACFVAAALVLLAGYR